jgi:hypothetical protein
MLVQVGEGVHRVSGGVTNFYLIEENGKYIVVDAGAPRDWACWKARYAGSARNLKTSTRSCLPTPIRTTWDSPRRCGRRWRAGVDSPGGRRGGPDRQARLEKRRQHVLCAAS